MTLYLVVWTVWACPGWVFGRLVPEVARPLVCAPAREAALYRHYGLAVDRVKRLGPSSQPALWRVDGEALTAIPLQWRTELEVQENP